MVRMCGPKAPGDETSLRGLALDAGATVMPAGTVNVARGAAGGVGTFTFNICRGSSRNRWGVVLGAAWPPGCTLVRCEQADMVMSASVAARARLRMVEARADAV